VEFEWGPREGGLELGARHGVSFEEASEIFADPLAATIADPRHSDGEPRWLTMGLSFSGRLLVAWHTDRRGHTRIIGARPPTPYERRKYGLFGDSCG
jgi:uncharacterized DUF497 family protein